MCFCLCACSLRLQRISHTSPQSRGRRSCRQRLMTSTKSFRRRRTKGEGSVTASSDLTFSLFLIFLQTGIKASLPGFLCIFCGSVAQHLTDMSFPWKVCAPANVNANKVEQGKMLFWRVETTGWKHFAEERFLFLEGQTRVHSQASSAADLCVCCSASTLHLL